MLMPSAVPRWSTGKASVRIAVELAISSAPPTPCTTRMTIMNIAADPPRPGVSDSAIDADREHGEPGVVHPDPPEHVAHLPEGDHEHGGDDQVAHEQPQQVADVGRRERVEVDPAEDGGQGDEHDRRVERRHEHAERGVRQHRPLVAVADRSVAAGRGVGVGAGEQRHGDILASRVWGGTGPQATRKLT